MHGGGGQSHLERNPQSVIKNLIELHLFVHLFSLHI